MTKRRAETPAHLHEIHEGADVFGSDGVHLGRVEDVGAKYLTITEGVLGRKEFYLPIALVACGDADRVELRVPVERARAEARAQEPDNEPIYSTPIRSRSRRWRAWASPRQTTLMKRTRCARRIG